MNCRGFLSPRRSLLFVNYTIGTPDDEQKSAFTRVFRTFLCRGSTPLGGTTMPWFSGKNTAIHGNTRQNSVVFGHLVFATFCLCRGLRTPIVHQETTTNPRPKLLSGGHLCGTLFPATSHVTYAASADDCAILFFHKMYLPSTFGIYTDAYRADTIGVTHVDHRYAAVGVAKPVLARTG